MVTTLYRGIAGKTLGSKLEALGLSTDFAGGVLLARAMEGGIRFGLGATIATTKDVLEKIGGLTALADYLGDDYELGARTAAVGRRDRVGRYRSPDRAAGLFFPRLLAAPDALGAQRERSPARSVLGTDCYVRAGLGGHSRCWRAHSVGGHGRFWRLPRLRGSPRRLSWDGECCRTRRFCPISGWYPCAIWLRWLFGWSAILEIRLCGVEPASA